MSHLPVLTTEGKGYLVIALSVLGIVGVLLLAAWMAGLIGYPTPEPDEQPAEPVQEPELGSVEYVVLAPDGEILAGTWDVVADGRPQEEFDQEEEPERFFACIVGEVLAMFADVEQGPHTLEAQRLWHLHADRCQHCSDFRACADLESSR